MSAEDTDVVFEGVIEISSNPASTSPKDWKPRLVVLKRQAGSKRASLDYYKDVRRRWQKQTAKGIISLWPWFQVSIAHNCSYKYPLKVTTSDHVLYMAAPSLAVMNKWIYYIQTQRLLDPPKIGLNVFSVQAQDSDAMNLIGARGNCELAISADLEIICALFPTRQIVGVWPFDSLRRYWCGDGIFGFHAGRRSPRGEGTYSFITSMDEDIYQMMENLIRKQKRTPSNGSSGSAGEIDNRPPAPLPADAHRSDTPPIQSSESDEDPSDWLSPQPPFGGDNDDIIVDRARAYDSIETPPLPPKPTSLRHEANSSVTKKKKGKSSSSLRMAPEAPDVSTTSPSYLKRNRTGSNPKWLHESFEPQNGDRSLAAVFPSRDVPPPPVTLTGGNVHPRDPLEEDTYSHTVHTFPAPFQRSNVVGGSLYNALVHRHNPDVPRKERPQSEADTTLYDVAFQPSRAAKTATLPVRRSDYGTINVEESKDTSNIPRTKTPLTKMPLSKSKGLVFLKPLEAVKDEAESPTKTTPQIPPQIPPQTPPQDSRELYALQESQSDDGLTVNPLYGSQENLLAEVKELNVREAAMLQAANQRETQEVPSPVRGDPETVTADEALRRDHREEEAAKQEAWGSEATDDPGAAFVTATGSNGSQQGDQQEESDSQPTSEPGGPIQRDEKGYSKVKKSKAAAVDVAVNSGREEGEDRPPPLPERLYSVEGDVISVVTDV